MKPSERDELLTRLDEKTANIYNLTEKQEKHLSKLNDRAAKSELNIDRNHNRLNIVEDLLANGLNVRFSRKQAVGGGVSLVTLLGLALTAVGKILGWW